MEVAVYAILARTDVETLRDVTLRLSRRLRRHAHTDLTMSQLSALSTLARHETTRATDLARREAIGKSTVTRLVARLEELGYVRRDPDPTDGRGFCVSVTALGHALLAEANERANGFLAGELGRLDPEDQAAILAALPALDRLVRLKR
jgi:DNA-binding MarR family transcriptional regulator